MKIYALAFFLVVCVFQNASADWKFEVKSEHWKRIENIVGNAIARIKAAATAEGTKEAQDHYEEARLGFRSISQEGKNNVTRCTRTAVNAGQADICAQQIDSQILNKAQEVIKNTIANMDDDA